jgi:protoporphyrinogen oxidase
MSTVVVGAGLSGLTVAHELARRGEAVTVVERDRAVGGLARTFRYGDFFFDVGPHRFHTNDPEVSAFLGRMLPADVLRIPRSSAVRAFRRLYDWPLGPRDLAALPISLVARAAMDLARRERLDGESFEADVVKRYGRTLYESFFQRYTERFLAIPPQHLHRDWARAGMDRAVIDSRYRADGLWSLLRSTLSRGRADTTFLYPAGGIDRLAVRLAAEVTRAGGRVLLGQAITAVETSRARVVTVASARERISTSRVIWTAPIGALAALVGLPHRGLEFLSTVLYNVELRSPSLLRHQWVYYGGEESFVRVSTPALFSPAAVPPGRGSLCVEVTCREGDPGWQGAESRVGQVADDLVRVGAIASAREVVAVHVERVADSYPIYALQYREALRHTLSELSEYENLLLLGRGGRFWYNNMDHSIAQALRVASQPLERESLRELDVGEREFWAAPPPGLRGACTAGEW